MIEHPHTWQIAAVVTALVAVALANGVAHTFKYPQPRTGDSSDNYFGTDVADPYRWMEDLNSPELTQWIDAENAITFTYLNAFRRATR